MRQRIIGFDLARAYAIFGMFIVNFNFSFGSFADPTAMGRFLNYFIGNSTAVFIILAGIGISLRADQSSSSLVERIQMKQVVLKRSWFLFAAGLILYNWWPGDILHYYGAYMHIAAFFLFVPKRFFLWSALFIVLVYHALLAIIPVSIGWDTMTGRYADFWTITGFVRNTLYNGWNSVFPWMTYFVMGMWMGQLNWKARKTKVRALTAGIGIFVVVAAIRAYSRNHVMSEPMHSYLTSVYYPPYVPFILSSIGVALIVIAVAMFIDARLPLNRTVYFFSLTGRLSLTLYVVHLTIGVLILSWVTGKPYTGNWNNPSPEKPAFILAYSVLFYSLCALLCYCWTRKFKNGPIETLMRKFSG